MNLPTGVGKSAILRTIQNEFSGSVGIVPTNILLDQYRGTYDDLNYVKGLDQYECKDRAVSCGDVKASGSTPCKDCPYLVNRARAYDGEATIFNPISYYYYTKSDKYVPPSVVVVDEAHKLTELLMLLTDCTFRKGYYNYPEIENEIQLLDWLELTAFNLAKLRKTKAESGAKKEAVTIGRQVEKMEMVIRSFKTNPQDFIYYTKTETYFKTTDEYLCISPIRPPRWVIDTILGKGKVVLMSATLLKHDVWDLGIKDFEYLDLPSPIPKESRPVVYMPHTEDMTYKTSAASVAKYIKRVMSTYPDRNTVVHLSYGWSKKLARYFPGALINTPQTKDDVLATFKREGGLWLAAGCAEGIDLPGDECRLTIIPIVLRANPKDPVTKKQVAQPGGWLRFELNAVKTLIQQVGRGTRGIDDHSISVIGDNAFPRLIVKNKALIPKSFMDAIIWRQV